MIKNKLHLIKLSLCCLLALVLTACASKPSTDTHQSQITDSTKTQDEQQASLIDTQVNRLKQAVKLAQEAKYQQSLRTLDSINLKFLPQQLYWLALETAATSSLAEQDGQLTLQLLDKFAPKQLNQQRYYSLFNFKAEAFLLTDNLEASIQQRFNQAAAASNTEEENQAYLHLWPALKQLDAEALNQLTNQEKSLEKQGWYQLALTWRSLAIDTNPDAFNHQWQTWQAQWQNHSAQTFMPEEMLQFAELASIQVKHLGVFLPQEGVLAAAGRAIQNSLIAAQLTALAQGENAPKLTFFNSYNQDLTQLYAQAQQAGVDLVIGPLAKAEVTLLESLDSLPLPTLALNYGTTHQLNSGLYQLGLSAEDEAEEVAHKAWQSGLRHALVLTPDGSWGTRVEQSFIKEWQKLGGQVDLTSQFGKSKSIDMALRELLEVELSQQRHQKITRLLGQRPDFTPYSRKDSDFVFLHATPASARQIKPALDFLLAGHLPVLATSSIYTGEANADLNKDMDGLIFGDIPWYVEEATDISAAIRAAWPNEMQSYGRLYALGQDAYFLALRLHLLESLPEASFAGATGRLRPIQGKFKRQLSWAKFSAGLARQLVADSLEELVPLPEIATTKLEATENENENENDDAQTDNSL